MADNVELIHADARKIDWRAWLDEANQPVRVIANLPYSVATPLLRRMLDLQDGLEDWSVMLQSEVAERLVRAKQPPKVLTAPCVIGNERAEEIFEAAYDEHAHRLAEYYKDI